MNLLAKSKNEQDWFTAESVAEVQSRSPGELLVTLVSGSRFVVNHPDSVAVLLPQEEKPAPVKKTRKKRST